jgi:Spy/CpxP family protein refolding chaperone
MHDLQPGKKGSNVMQRKLICLVGLGAVVLLGASDAAAQPLGPGEGGPGRMGLDGPARVLNLTEGQRAAAREIFEHQRPEREALHAEMRENRRALRDALESGAADPCVVGEIVIEGEALRQRGRALSEESKKAFAGLLDEEQRKKLETLEAARALLGPLPGPGMRGPGGGGWGPPEGGPDQE